MTELVTTHIGVVYPWQHDHMNHMNVQYYVAKFDEATWNIFAEIGMTKDFLEANDFGMAAVQQNITYRREMMAGDLVEIRSGFLEVGERKCRFVHEMRNRTTGEVTAISELTGVALDTKTRRSRNFPDDVRQRAEALLTGYDPTGKPSSPQAAA